MVTVSLRLSDSEHARLREWAFGSRRSLQREIVFRLFDGALVTEAGVGSAGSDPGTPGVPQRGTAVPSSPVSVAAASRSWSLPSERDGNDLPMREAAAVLALRDGRCSADVARGTKCKLCGKVHG